MVVKPQLFLQVDGAGIASVDSWLEPGTFVSHEDWFLSEFRDSVKTDGLPYLSAVNKRNKAYFECFLKPQNG